MFSLASSRVIVWLGVWRFLCCADEEDDEATLPLKPLSKSAATAAKAAAAKKAAAAVPLKKSAAAAAVPKNAAKDKLFKACLCQLSPRSLSWSCLRACCALVAL